MLLLFQSSELKKLEKPLLKMAGVTIQASLFRNVLCISKFPLNVPILGTAGLHSAQMRLSATLTAVLQSPNRKANFVQGSVRKVSLVLFYVYSQLLTL